MSIPTASPATTTSNPQQQANVEGWGGSANDKNSGSGKYGSCCAEMDIWEANLDATAYTPHPCKVTGQTRCEGTDCGNGDERYSGMCDKGTYSPLKPKPEHISSPFLTRLTIPPDGCDFNSFRMGDQDFYGTSKTVDTSKPFTIVTQFITDSGTDTGTLKSIKRFYVQGGKVIPNSVVAIEGIDPVNDISDSFCAQQKTVFGDNNYFATIGGMAKMGEQLKKMVLVLSVWDDHAVSMNWLDSNYPVEADAAKPGIARGRCDPTAGDPKTVEAAHPDASVVYSNIKLGAINSTFKAA